MPERFIHINGTNDVTVQVNATADTTIFLPEGGGTLAALGSIPTGIAAGTQTGSTGTIAFSNSNGITFGMNNNSVITATVRTDYQSSNANYLTTQSNPAFSAQGGSSTFQTLVFTNSNGISFSNTNGSIWGSHNGITSQTAQTVGLYALGNTTQNSSTTLDARTLSFNGLGAATVGYSNGSIQISVPTQTIQTQSLIAGIYDGANSISTGTVRFTNANGVSFSVNGQTISASVNPNVSLYALGNTTQNSSTVLNVSALSFNGLGVASIGYSNGSIQVSVPAGGGGAGTNTIGMSNIGNTLGDNTPINGSAVRFVFAGGNNITLSQSTNGSSATMTIVGPTQTVQSQSNIAGVILSNTTYGTGTVSFSDGNGISWASGANQAISITHGLQHTSATSAITSNALNTSASRVINIIAATNNTGGGAASLSSNVSFTNANSFTFYTSAGGAIAGSFSQSADTNKAGTGFTSAGNNIGLSGTLSTNGFSLSATVAAQTNQTVGVYGSSQTTGSISSGTHDARSLSFIGAGMISVGNHSTSIGGTTTGIVISAPASSNFRLSNDGIGLNTAQTNVTWTVNSSGISFNAGGYAGTTSGSAGNIGISMTHNTAGLNLSLSQSNQAFSAAGGSSSFQTLAFADSNQVSFTNTNGSVGIASIKLSMFAVGNTTQSTNGTANHTALSFAGAGIASVGVTNGSVVISVPAGGGGGDGYNIIGFNGVATSLSTTYVFSNSNGIGFGINAGTATLSYDGYRAWELEGNNTLGTTATSAESKLYFSGGDNITLSGNSNTIVISANNGNFTGNTYQNRQLGASTNTVPGQNSVWLAPMRLANAVNAVTGLHIVSLTGTATSNQTNTVGYTWRGALYKVTGTNVSRFDSIFTTSIGLTVWNSGTNSASYSYNATSASSAGSNILVSSLYGLRQITFNIGSTLDAGLYAWGYVQSSSSAGNSSILRSFNAVVDNPLAVAMGFFGSSSTNNSIGYADAGTFSVTSASMPASFVFSEIRQTLNVVPYFKMGAV